MARTSIRAGGIPLYSCSYPGYNWTQRLLKKVGLYSFLNVFAYKSDTYPYIVFVPPIWTHIRKMMDWFCLFVFLLFTYCYQNN